MVKDKSGSVEIVLLGLFKWVVVAAMLLLMLGAAGLLVAGGVHMTGQPVAPEPAKPAAPPKFDAADYLKTLSPEEVPDLESEEVASEQLSEDSGEKMLESQLERLWAHFERFQIACKGSATYEKSAFLETLRQSPLKRLLEARGDAYAESQEKFVGVVLAKEETLKLCKAGKGGVFLGAIDFHRESWDKQVKAAEEFETAEALRVRSSEASEAARIEERRAFAMRAFIAAGVAFGLFMLVALVLIFARIESNLRGVATRPTGPG